MQHVADLTPILDLLLLGAFVEGELQGVAFVTPPEVNNTGKQEAKDKLDEQLAIDMGEAVILRLEAYSQIKEANQPQQPHFYLNTLGVMPKSQGQGVGKALMAELHKLSEESPQSSGVALDTENEQNLNFYQHLGYSVSTITNLDRVKIWSMFRQ
ncbi:MAG: GNAT family N-acetyltransferase [Xenococcaceae cyanobacterium MO_188.B32]|nr:GNAT family N-acetyltransferase [Xenococcaceae cyanobacterium MO_188.B32]